MQKHVKFVFTLLIAFATVSCGKSDSVQSDLLQADRMVQDFADFAELFGGDDTCYDADVGEVQQGPGLNSSYRGTIWADADGTQWAVGTSLCEEGDNNYSVQYRFLGEGTNAGDLGPVLTVTNNAGNPIVGELGLPRVAACYFYNSSYPDDTDYTFVEVTVVFQFEQQATPVNQEIRCVRMGFDPDDFSEDLANIEPDWTEDYIFNYDSWDDIMADVAYDPGDGDLCVVFSRYIDASTVYVYMRKCNRSTPGRDVIWWASFQAQSSGHNGFHPRIDIGKCALYPYSEQWMTGIAYTEGGATFRTRLNYMPAGTWPPIYTYDTGIPDWEWPNQAGGIPQIDIGPPGSNHGAIVWTQSRSGSWNDVTVSYVDTHGGYSHFHEDSGAISSAFPSVAVHRYTGDPEEDPYRSSVSYLYTANHVTGPWYVCMRYVDTDPWGGESDLGPQRLPDEDIRGLWDSGSVYNHYYGMSTALTVYDNNYWMVWSSVLSGQSGPEQVHGTFGYTW